MAVVRQNAIFYEGFSVACEEKVDPLILEEMRAWLREKGVEVVRIAQHMIRTKKSFAKRKKKKATSEQRREWNYRYYRRNHPHTPEKYKIRAPKIIRQYFMSIRSGDHLIKYNLDIPQFHLIRTLEERKVYQIVTKESMFEFLKERGMIQLDTANGLREIWYFVDEMQEIETLKSLFGWHMNNAYDGGMNLLEIRQRGYSWYDAQTVSFKRHYNLE